MEQFKKDLLKVCKTSSVASIILLAFAALFLVLGLTSKVADYVPFDAISDDYATLDVTYVMGPFAELTENNKTTDEFYIAEDTLGYWYIVDMGTHNNLPVYGEDVMDDGISALTPVTIQGKGTKMDTEMLPYLVQYFEGSGAELTETEVYNYFGDHYLDTTNNSTDNSIFFYVMMLVFVIIAVICKAAGQGKKKGVKKQIAELEQSGQLQTLYSDSLLRQPIYSSKLKIGVLAHYVLNYNAAGNGFQIIPLDQVTNVFKCNMLQGEPTAVNYIALETTDNMRYCVAPCNTKSREFDTILGQMKRLMNGGAQL